MIYVLSQSGAILRIISAPIDEAEKNINPGESWVDAPGDYANGEWYYSGDEFVKIPPSPSPAHSWDWIAYEWVVTSTAINDLKARRAAEVNSIRDEMQYLPVLYDGVLFDADPHSRTAMTGLEARIRRGDGLTAPWSGWRTYDNNFVWADATAEQVQQHLTNLQLLLEDRWQVLLNRSWVLKDTLLTLSGADDVLAFDVKAGWPD